MRNKLFVLCLALYCSFCVVAVEINSATVSELNAIKGIGPVLAEKIVQARTVGRFQNWEDLALRIKGIGSKSALKLSLQGLTVNGTPFPQNDTDTVKKKTKP